MKPGLAILLVEDEAIIAMDLRNRLVRAGCGRCRVVSTGEAAVSWAGTETYDMIVMDNHLAGTMNGIEAATRIWAKKDIPVIFMTGYPNDEILREKTRLLRTAACLDKPVVFEDLVAVIEALSV
jgi:DNA-binding response OmpR family regulator